jgi:uncharacterized membrane protein YczE
VNEWLDKLKPYKTVPVTPWTAKNRWDFGLQRFAILTFGLFIFGLGDSLLIISGLGNAPWSVLAQGISVNSGLSIGVSTLIISALVLALWIPLRERPGLGTISNILIIAFAIDLGIHLFPDPKNFAFELTYVFVGIAMVGIGSALYITCGLGPGPRDGWMTSIHRRTGIPVGRVRLMIELFVLTLGVILGGTAGLGTALFAVFIGYSVALSFGVVSRITRG